MINVSPADNQIQGVANFQDLVSMSFCGEMNAICWTRTLTGDFSEIVKKVAITENMVELDKEQLLDLELTEQGQLARKIILNDLKLLKNYGAAPILNLIRYYERDDACEFFPTDVYSFHVDRSPVPTDTFLCTYYGNSSEIVPNTQAIQKVFVPEIRDELKKLYHGAEEGFESFLRENFFDLHYQAKPAAHIINLGHGHLWRLAVDHPESKVLPCIHRAPEEKSGQTRLMMIC